ncbi:MAG: glycosyltransferase family A protein [Pseudomonadota bacterium]
MRDPAALLNARILIVFATHNGANTLRTMLSAYEEVDQPTRSWAIVAVDNASTDETSQVLAHYAQRLPLVTLDEAKPGKNHALNRALDAVGSSADLYIFTDDDAVPKRDFLQQWEAVLDAKPDIELFGGAVSPVFEQEPPGWLRKYRPHFPELYAITDHAEGPIAAERIFGPNMAVRGSILAKGVRFNGDIGPNASQSEYPMGSETEFCQRAVRHTEAAPWFAAGPKVQHIVRPFQMTKEFVGKRAYRHGRGTAMRQSMIQADGLAFYTSLKSRLFTALAGLAASAEIGRFWWTYNWRRGFASWKDVLSARRLEDQGP